MIDTDNLPSGLQQQDIRRLMARLDRYGVNLHSVLMSCGGSVFYEEYRKPFRKDMPHRLYSVTKSFVSAAIGCLYDDGAISLDDPIIRYFPDKLPDRVHPYLAGQTIRDMLMMCTCFAGNSWFRPGVRDRLRWYFSQTPVRPSGTVFDYDSTGSYVLGVLVERVSGKPLLQFMKERFLNRIGGFENAAMLSVPDGTPWGDSALIASPRGLLNFATLIMHLGTWQGEQLIGREYLRAATSFQTDNNIEDRIHYNRCGYGYQIWMTYSRSFSFNGMGGQFAICVPDRDFVFVCTCDNQMSDSEMSPVIFNSVFECIADRIGPAVHRDEKVRRSILTAHGDAYSPFSEQINRVWFECDENEMGIRKFCFVFSDDHQTCTWKWINAQGEKQLLFGMGENRYGYFPQLGYSDERGNVHDSNSGFMYRCAASAGWAEQKKLQLRVQVTDRYFGQFAAVFGFKDRDTVGIRMIKNAEDFFGEYQGWTGAHRMKSD